MLTLSETTIMVAMAAAKMATKAKAAQKPELSLMVSTGRCVICTYAHLVFTSLLVEFARCAKKWPIATV